ncbi:unnamed protein product [Prorocentrum cordatum]|uniref:Uncharacterized protein n=1 Tax=Prorocentrum cordatum TaxID=2364126 RepID=A0ABN9WMS6_9DINO|nr:unnamed protein product [Polarella glacialis]
MTEILLREGARRARYPDRGRPLKKERAGRASAAPPWEQRVATAEGHGARAEPEGRSGWGARSPGGSATWGEEVSTDPPPPAKLMLVPGAVCKDTLLAWPGSLSNLRAGKR